MILFPSFKRNLDLNPQFIEWQIPFTTATCKLFFTSENLLFLIAVSQQSHLQICVTETIKYIVRN